MATEKSKFVAGICLAAGALLGYAAASGNLNPFEKAQASLASQSQKSEKLDVTSGDDVSCCVTGKQQLLAMADPKVQEAVAKAGANGKKPNILFIMGDDIGWMQPSCYHRGLMVGETPNIDRIAKEGGMFLHYYAEQSCTAGRNAFITGMQPLRTGMIPPQLPGSPSYLRPGTPALAVFLHDLGYTTGEFGKNHLGDHTKEDDADPCHKESQAILLLCLGAAFGR